VLPQLAPVLPLAVPRPLFVGRPDGDYPWPFFGAELVPGQEAGGAELDDDARLTIALELARFLRTLHGVALDVDLPFDPNRRTDMKLRVQLAREVVAELERLGMWRAPARLETLLDSALALPPPEPPAIVHGDLHFRHLLVRDGAASGVIDWGDVCRSDPAIDLPLLWSFVPPDGRAAFVDAYGLVTEPQLVRARVLAVQLCATLAHFGRVESNARVERAGIDGLERALLD
jgi:aminoglycoside phosphotransferase (APT) family kinase protein